MASSYAEAVLRRRRRRRHVVAGLHRRVTVVGQTMEMVVTAQQVLYQRVWNHPNSRLRQPRLREDIVKCWRAMESMDLTWIEVRKCPVEYVDHRSDMARQSWSTALDVDDDDDDDDDDEDDNDEDDEDVEEDMQLLHRTTRLTG